MPTSEIKRLGKIISEIAKNNGEKYSSVEISLTNDGYSKEPKSVYRAYINDLVPWLSSDSLKGLIYIVNEHINNINKEKNN